MKRPLLLTWEQVRDETSFGRTKIFELMASGELESVKVGRCRRVPAAALAEYVERLRKTAADMQGLAP